MFLRLPHTTIVCALSFVHWPEVNTSPLKILVDGRARRAGVVRVGRQRASPIEGEDLQGGEGEESREVQEKAVRRKRRRQ